MLLILDVYPLRRLGRSLGWWSEPARRVYVEKLPFVLLAAATSALAFRAQVLVHTIAPLAQLSVPARLGVSAYGLSFYLWKMLVPLNLSPLYERPLTVDPWATPFILSYGLVLATTAIALALHRRVPGLSAAWSAYVVVLLPVLGIVQIGPQIAADRYTYLASLGWALLAGAGLGSCWRTSSRWQTGTPTVLLLAGIATANASKASILPSASSRIDSLEECVTQWRTVRKLVHVTPPDSSSATGRPSGRGNEFRRDRPPEEPVQSNRCRGPGDSAPHGSAPQTL